LAAMRSAATPSTYSVPSSYRKKSIGLFPVSGIPELTVRVPTNGAAAQYPTRNEMDGKMQNVGGPEPWCECVKRKRKISCLSEIFRLVKACCVFTALRNSCPTHRDARSALRCAACHAYSGRHRLTRRPWRKSLRYFFFAFFFDFLAVLRVVFFATFFFAFFLAITFLL